MNEPGGWPWGPLATDIDRALARAKMGDYEQILMQYVREHSWAKATRRKAPGKGNQWPDALPVAWKPSDIAQALGEPRSRISEAKTSLVESRMLAESAAGLTVNKEAHLWIFPPGHKRAGEPRLATHQVTYAKAAQPDPSVSASADKSVRSGGHEDFDGCPDSRTRVSASADKGVRQSGQECPPKRTPHYKDRARKDPTGLDPKKIPEEQASRAGEPVGDLIDSLLGSLEPFESEPEPPPLPEIVGPGKDSPEALALASWADRLGADPKFGSYAFWAREQCEFSPAAWVRSILERKVVGNARRPSLSLLNAIIAGWRERREPEWPIGVAGEPAAPNGHPAPAPIRLTPSEARRQKIQADLRARFAPAPEPEEVPLGRD